MIVVLATGCGLYIPQAEHLDRVDADLDGTPASQDCDDGDPEADIVREWFADVDEDGVGGGEPTVDCYRPAGHVLAGGDCDDEDPDNQELQVYLFDGDGDGFGGVIEREACGPPPDHVAQGGDCDDDDVYVYPDAPEYCDDIDNDCDGDRDEDEVTLAWFDDLDGDGFGDPDSETEQCAPQPTGVANGDDCDDSSPAVNPEAPEQCDGVDNDCNDLVDLDDPGNVGDANWYRDDDEDGYGRGVGQQQCSPPDDGNTWSTVSGDCDDDRDDVHPGAPEVCDGVDNDCLGDVDLDDPDIADAITFHRDADDDGFGDPLQTAIDCEQPNGFVDDDTDCNDSSDNAFPQASEVVVSAPGWCNDQLDNDCDGVIDGGDDDCDDDDGDGEPNGYDALFTADVDGNGDHESVCVRAALTMPPAQAAEDAVREVRESPILPIDSVDPSDTDVLVDGAWCWNLTSEPADTYIFRYVSTLGLDPDDCSTWVRSDLDAYCFLGTDPLCTGANTAIDECEALSPGFAVRVVWDGTSL